MALTKEDVFSVLRTCRDPEIPVNIVDLGLVYGVQVQEAGSGYDVSVNLTLTSPVCPKSRTISADVQRRLLEMDAVQHARVNLVWEPAWHPSMMTAEGREQLNPT